MMNVAREIEEPILDYTRQNGEGFRVLLPSLARFLGKNRDEAATPPSTACRGARARGAPKSAGTRTPSPGSSSG